MNNISVTLSTDGTASVQTPAQRSNDSLAHKQHLIESALDRYTQFSADCPELLREAIRYSLLTPGKRLRPMLVMLAAEACGGNAEMAVPAACAVEMIHTYSLIHDDLPSMDNDDARRGRPTCHKKFGEGVAILAGDALLALAFEVIAKDIAPTDVAVACCATLAQAAGATALVGGQCDDIGQELASGSRELLESIHNRKTGALFLASLRLGGLVAGASAVEIEALREFGANLGLAFQITDDLLDVREDRRSGAVKKKKGDWGKLTFPNLIGEKQSRQEVERLVAAACQALAPFGNNSRSLRALATFVSERI
jgi:geranylgeranyl diphosphate synthase, type II